MKRPGQRLAAGLLLAIVLVGVGDFALPTTRARWHLRQVSDRDCTPNGVPPEGVTPKLVGHARAFVDSSAASRLLPELLELVREEKDLTEGPPPYRMMLLELTPRRLLPGSLRDDDRFTRFFRTEGAPVPEGVLAVVASGCWSSHEAIRAALPDGRRTGRPRVDRRGPPEPRAPRLARRPPRPAPTPDSMTACRAGRMRARRELMAHVEIQTRKFTRAEYELLAEAGILGPDDHVELLEGEIVLMPAKGARHSIVCDAVIAELSRVFRGGGFYVRGQNPLALGKLSEPEPDAAVVAGQRSDYGKRHPQSAVLVVEVADSSLELDRDVKSEIYAEAGIQEYWIVNLRADEVEVRRTPKRLAKRFGYEELRTLSGRGVLTPLVVPRARIRVASLFE